MSAHAGTASRYKAGCRCPACREANRAYQAQYRQEAAARATEDGALITHGVSGYQNWGCRCAACTAEANRVRRDQKRAAARRRYLVSA